MVKEFLFYGKKEDEVKNLSMDEFMKLIPSRSRRSLKRGLTDAEKRLMALVDKKAKNIKTHCRDMIIVPAMIGLMLHVYNGKAFVPVSVTAQMLGHRLGEFAHTRGKVSHSAPGIGATRSSAAMSVR
jgi:small subunit ribosomal protein S19